jgi:hypothetical protein
LHFVGYGVCTGGHKVYVHTYLGGSMSVSILTDEEHTSLMMAVRGMLWGERWMILLNHGSTVPMCTEVMKSSLVNKQERQYMKKRMCLCHSSYL